MQPSIDARALREALGVYQRPDARRGVLEIALTFLPLAGLWATALFLVQAGSLWGLALIGPAALLLVRLFMIQHDCGHGSFFPSTSANHWTGRLIGVMTMTPFDYWRRTHALHHATSGNLDRRGLGALETLTVDEYRARSSLGRLAYRLYRHPLVMFGIGPAYMFLLQHRLPVGLLSDGRAWLSAIANTAGLAVLILTQALIFGPTTALAVHLPIVVLAGAIGIWLFYVQHQFEGATWMRNGAWDHSVAGFNGSSHLHLPQPLRWLTANIGAHHVHHLRARIPFYRLPDVLRAHPALQAHGRLTLRDAIGAVRLALWDEPSGRLISFAEERKGRRVGQSSPG
jgi:omega-6 fatty acid desaturase (delta-12 desaturase)